jgi:hypothetical protein
LRAAPARAAVTLPAGMLWRRDLGGGRGARASKAATAAWMVGGRWNKRLFAIVGLSMWAVMWASSEL